MARAAIAAGMKAWFGGPGVGFGIPWAGISAGVGADLAEKVRGILPHRKVRRLSCLAAAVITIIARATAIITVPVRSAVTSARATLSGRPRRITADATAF
jgi:hypothetical protein